MLGHCDYVKEHLGVDGVSEHVDNSQCLNEENIRIRKAFEAEADRQAGQWLVGFFENALGNDGRGIDFLFPRRVDVYEFFSYVITSVFVMLQQVATNGKNNIHPLPNQRQFILLSAIDDYLQKKELGKNEISKELCVVNMYNSAKNLGLAGVSSPIDIVTAGFDLVFVDDVISETKIRKYQHVVTRNKSN